MELPPCVPGDISDVACSKSIAAVETLLLRLLLLWRPEEGKCQSGREVVTADIISNKL